MNLLQMSFTAGILILGIGLFRSLFLHRLPKKVMIILWEIVILRLLLPFSSDALPGIGTLAAERIQPVNENFGTVKVSLMDMDTDMESSTVVICETEGSGTDWSRILRMLYLAGAAVMAAGSVWLYVKDSRFLRESLPVEQKRREGLIRLMGLADLGEKERKVLDRIDFRTSDRTATPVTCGMFRPVIVLPAGFFLKEEREVGFCLLHELIHIRNHDNLRKMAVHGVLCIHWFNPMVWAMYSLCNRDMELLCDETAVCRCRARRKDYALALLSMAERRNQGFCTALGFGKNAVKERILAVMKGGRTTAGGILAASLVLILALTAFLGGSVSASARETALNRIGEYTITTDKNMMDEAAYTAFINLETHLAAEEAVRQESTGTEMSAVRADAKADTETDTGTGAEADTEAEANAVTESEVQTEDFEESVRKLVEEFKDYGLEVEITANDYQLYFQGKPVYFFADNRKQNGEGFSGRVYAKPAGGENGDTGVATVRDESGVIVGLVNLSREESAELAGAWTGKH